MKFKVVKEEKDSLKLKDLQVGQFFRFKNDIEFDEFNENIYLLINNIDEVESSNKFLLLKTATSFCVDDELEREVILLRQINEIELEEV